MADGSFDLDADVVELAPYVPPENTAPLREVAYRADGWSAEAMDTLRCMFLADEDMADIAEACGHTFHATRTKVCVLGLRRNSKRPWTELEDAEIVRRYGEHATAAIAQDLGRGVYSIYNRAGKLGLMEGRPPPWTPWEDEQLRAGYDLGVPVLQIAALIGRPVSGVLSRASDFLKVKHLNAPKAWAERELALAVELAGEGATNRQITARLLAEGFPDRGRGAVKQMMIRVVEGRGWGRLWTDEEDEVIRRAYQAGESLTPVRLRIGRSRGAMRYRVGYLGLQGTHVLKAGWLVDPVWTKEEDELLRTSYGKVRGKKLKALFPHRRGQAVYMRASVLGLEAGYSKATTEDELRAIQIAYVVGIGFTDLGIALGLDTASVHRMAKQMGLRFSDRSRPRVPKTPRSKRPPPPTLAEILAMPAAIPDRPFLPMFKGWRKRNEKPQAKETADVAG